MDQIRVRFAPSPTGLLHIGNARTALFNCVFARHLGGTLVLRIEDTDVERSTDESAHRILEDLRWLGLQWDEGPDREGQYGPYRQSERQTLYSDYAERLLREGRAYKCFCSPERLDSLRKEQIAKGTMPRYDGRCRSLTPQEVSGTESSGVKPAIRFQVGRGAVPFDDLIHGRMNFESEGIGDFIIMRSDGTAAYNFACVIDDHLMAITHVIRGEDHLSNTPRQIQIYKTLGWEPPQFAHHTLILGPDRTPLSKRHGATTVSQYREEGFLPEALLNYLVLLGWTPPSRQEMLTFDEIVRDFSIDSVSRSAPIFNRKKLEWINSHYIRKMEDDTLRGQFLSRLEKAGLSVAQIDSEYLAKVTSVLKDNLVVLSQFEEYLGIFFDDRFRLEDDARALLMISENRATLEKALEAVQSGPDMNEEGWHLLVSSLEEKTGKKGKSLLAPFRAAVTGKTRGPELARTLPLLGKERILGRLEAALQVKPER
jgi:nondiscriminating glutamyl-tRNA synthetase